MGRSEKLGREGNGEDMKAEAGHFTVRRLERKHGGPP